MISRTVLRAAYRQCVLPTTARIKLTGSHHGLSTQLAITDPNEPSAGASKPKLKADFRRTFNTPELEHMLQSFPPKLLNKKQNVPESMYVAHPKAVDAIAEHVLSGHSRHKTFVEINPGLGLLTRKLLGAQVDDIRLFEGTREMLPYLNVGIYIYILGLSLLGVIHMYIII